jgi:asparagine N-glycosylation enzyme membrane subunit Stt3
MNFWLSVLAVILGLLAGIAVIVAVVVGVVSVVALILVKLGRDNDVETAISVIIPALSIILAGIGIVLLVTSITQIAHNGLTWWDAFNLGLSIQLVLSLSLRRKREE